MKAKLCLSCWICVHPKQNEAESLFGQIDDALKKEDVNWNKCVAVGMDNTSVNMGINNSIKTRVLEKN